MRDVIRYRHAAGILVMLVAASLLSGCVFNNIPKYNQQVKAAWSQVLNEYQRRTDLVPNLVATVKASAAHEHDTLVQVTKALSKVGSLNISKDITENPEAFKKFQKAQSGLTSALSHLMVVSERYPNLKANQNFLTLQAQLEGTENRITVARRDYILAVQKYNTELTTIPGRWIASAFYPDAKQKQNFTISKKARQAPKVKF